MGGRGTLGLDTRLDRSSSNFAQMRVNAVRICWLVPITVTIRSGQEPSVILIFAPLSSLNFLTISPFLPIILPTSGLVVVAVVAAVSGGF